MINNQLLSNIKSLSLASLLLMALSSCGVYSTGFNCPDSRGAKCIMLSRVDQMVNSGEIEKIYWQCKGKKCQSQLQDPSKRLGQIHQVNIQDQQELEEWQDGDDLYLK